MKKGEITRRLNLLAGSRPPLPGHMNLRETNLRLELAECFEPVNAIEMLWVSDIAYCTGVIEVLRAQIAGCRMRMLKEVYITQLRHDAMSNEVTMENTDGILFLPGERAYLGKLVGQSLQGHRGQPLLEHQGFTTMLGQMGHRDVEHLQLLQQMLHDEARERDRLVNQLDRRRRQAMRDAIEESEAKQRAAVAAAAHAASPQDGSADPDGFEPADQRLVSGNAEIAEEENDEAADLADEIDAERFEDEAQ